MASPTTDRATLDGNGQRSLPELVGDMTQDLSTLLRKEVELAREEIKVEVRKAARAGGGFGAAAYATGWLVRSAGLPPELGILAGTFFAGVLGLGVGLLAIRRQGIYFAMITLALAQMIYFVWLQAPFTGGNLNMELMKEVKC